MYCTVSQINTNMERQYKVPANPATIYSPHVLTFFVGLLHEGQNPQAICEEVAKDIQNPEAIYEQVSETR